MNLDVNTDTDHRKQLQYELYATINRHGISSGGHYTACCKGQVSHKWHHYNDSQVTEVDIKNIPSKKHIYSLL